MDCRVDSAKVERLEGIVRSCGSALVALSGGVDSTVLSGTAHEVLGGNALSATVVSEFFISRERAQVDDFVRAFGVRHEYLSVSVLEGDDRIASNPPDRCYLCKRAIFERLLALAGERGIGAVLDGTNADDLREDRPGVRALRELGVRSPYVEAGFGKRDIVALARERGLERFVRPSNTCLATRIPPGTRITREILGMVERAEETLRGLGFETARVRYHEPGVARVEVPEADMGRLLERGLLKEIGARFRGLGFKRSSVDVDGYSPGGGLPSPGGG